MVDPLCAAERVGRRAFEVKFINYNGVPGCSIVFHIFEAERPEIGQKEDSLVVSNTFIVVIFT